MRKYVYLLVAIIVSNMGNAQNLHPKGIIAPKIEVRYQHNESPIRISSVNMDVKVVGTVAITTVEMVFYNPNDRILEGQLNFPLSEGQSISRFALDMNGQLREGVVVEKAKGQEAFEAVARRRVDPGLLEKTQGNNFRTRIYPLPARGSRRVVIAYEEGLKSVGDKYQIHVPVEYQTIIPKFDLNVTVYDPSTKPEEEESPWGDFQFNKVREAYIGTYSKENFPAKGQLVFSIPVRDKQVMVEKGKISGDTYFYANVEAPVYTSSKKSSLPSHIALYWDISASMAKRNFKQEEALLQKYFELLKNADVDLYTFNCFLDKPTRFQIKDGNWDDLKRTLQNAAYDGATQMGNLDFRKMNDSNEAILVFSDGLSNFGKLIPQVGKTPVSVINSSLVADQSMLHFIATTTGGKYIDLTKQTVDVAVQKLLFDGLRFISAEYDKNQISDLSPSLPQDLEGSSFTIAGKLKVATASIKLNFGVGNKITFSKTIVLSRDNAQDYSNLVERIWAEKKINELDLLYDQNKDEIQKLGQRFNIVTRNTSLIVLENLSDYVKYRITPPDELLEQYKKEIAQLDEQEAIKRKENLNELAIQLNRAAENFDARKTWWNKTFPKNKLLPETKTAVRPARDRQLPHMTLIDPVSGISGSLTGIVVDGQNEPVLGATVRIEGTNTGTVTDERGRFGINPPASANRLSISFVGLETQVVTLEPRYRGHSLKIVLPEAETLNEVVVVGNTSQRREALVGAIESDEVSDQTAGYESPRIERMVSGRMAGVRVVHKAEDLNSQEIPEASAQIELNNWNPDEPYLKILKPKNDKEIYATYLTIKDGYKDAPSFYLDVASLFEERGLKKEALIILSNLAELKVENYRLERVLGNRLRQLGYTDYAIEQFEKVAKLRPEEPQSFRDLAAAYIQKREYQKAIDNLYKIVKGRWDGRFPQIEVTAAEEMNATIAEAQAKSVTVNLDSIDDRMLYKMPVDVRVVLNWDTDNSDMDLWVTDPYGELCKYDHNRTRIGGFLSNDFTGGYGPEEFMIRNAVEGVYKIQANYFGDRETSLIGPTTIYLDIYTFYGTPRQTKKTITLRLTDKKEVIDIGTIVFKR